MEFRHEYKYMISVPQALLLKERITSLMEADAHAGETGTYEIRSIYFDDQFDTYYHQNEAGTDPRSKFRIRIYNGSDERIVLEKKMKQNGMTKKRQQVLSMTQYEMLTGFELDTAIETVSNGAVGGADALSSAISTYEPCHIGLHMQNFDTIHEQPSLVQELMLLKQTKLARPKVIVSYERTPFIEKNGNVRVTFDDGISSSTDYLQFFEKDMHKRPIMPVGQTLMEVKFDEFLPAYIKEALETGHLQQTTFSKYYLCRRYHL